MSRTVATPLTPLVTPHLESLHSLGTSTDGGSDPSIGVYVAVVREHSCPGLIRSVLRFAALL